MFFFALSFVEIIVREITLSAFHDVTCREFRNGSFKTDSRALGYVEFRGCGARMAFHTSKCVDAEISSPKSPSVGKYRQGEKWLQVVKLCLGSTSIS